MGLTAKNPFEDTEELKGEEAQPGAPGAGVTVVGIDHIAVAVADLPAALEHYRTVFDLCVRQGMPYQDAGKQLDLPTGTVAIRIMRARKRLFAALQQHLGRLRRPPACFQ